MLHIKAFTFNPFQENTYLLYDDTKECIIIDPGCYTDAERNTLVKFITDNQLKPVKLINTHCHIDHVLGNKFIAEHYDLVLEMHEADLPTLLAVPSYAGTFGIEAAPSPEPGLYLEEGDIVKFGNTELKVLFTPGHSAGSISFYSEVDETVIVGDVLFMQSIGRTDLPGGDYDTLIKSIQTKLFTLPDVTKVYPGHGPATAIGLEKMNNPFFR
jgi:hydroxyacylglutathione hydrolase